MAGVFQLSILTLLVEMTLYSLIFMIDYALVARSVLRSSGAAPTRRSSST